MSSVNAPVALYFPWSDSREKLVRTLAEGEMKIASAKVTAVLLDTITPDSGAGEYNPLLSLHTLDIADKHKLIIPVISKMTIRGVAAEGGGSTMENTTIVMKPGIKTRMMQIFGDGHMKVTDHGKATIEIAFQEPGALEGEAVVPAIHQLSQLVSRVIDAIAKTY